MSVLLPRHAREFHEKSFWDKFFHDRKAKSFEWYGSYTDMKPFFYQQLKKTPLTRNQSWKFDIRILVIGCGNSDLSHELYKDGFQHITSIDYSETVVHEMKTKHPFLDWRVMDASALSFPSESFDIVIDKALLDAVLSENKECVLELGTNVLAEADRVLVEDGLFFSLTMAQNYVLRHILSYFIFSNRYTIAMHEIPSETPLHAFIMSAQRSSSLRTLVSYDSRVYSSEQEDEKLQFLLTSTHDAQWFCTIEHALKTLEIGRQIFIELFSNHSKIPRFVLRVVDAMTNGKSSAVLLIPQGREHEWIFSSEEGVMDLARNAGFNRLILVTLGREHTFSDLKEIQNELDAIILRLIIKDGAQIPYLTVGEGIGQRQMIAKGESPCSGKYCIEQVTENGANYRRLIFLSNMNVIQSEVRLIKKKKKKRIDRKYLSFPYHRAMTSILAAHMQENHHSLVIGLGGGCLPQYIHDTFPLLSHMNVCELDVEMLSVAQRYFGYQESERMNVVLEDGIAYVARCAKESPATLNSIIVDVDAKDRKSGMSCPPAAFVDDTFIKDCHVLLKHNGLLMLNISSRSKTLYNECINRINARFRNSAEERVVYELCATKEDVNRIVFVEKGSERRFLNRSEEFMSDIRLAVAHA